MARIVQQLQTKDKLLSEQLGYRIKKKFDGIRIEYVVEVSVHGKAGRFMLQFTMEEWARFKKEAALI